MYMKDHLLNSVMNSGWGVSSCFYPLYCPIQPPDSLIVFVFFGADPGFLAPGFSGDWVSYELICMHVPTTQLFYNFNMKSLMFIHIYVHGQAQQLFQLKSVECLSSM